MKEIPEHFRVEEILGFEPDGEGEHVFLWVEKAGLNTDEVADRLARFASVSRRQISYAGLKDKNALTRQWFSAHLPGKGALPWEDCRGEGFQVLRWYRNRRKLKRGALTGNHFRIRILGFSGDRRQAESILSRMTEQGMANYFGVQRFGNRGGNIERALAWFEGGEKPGSRYLKGLYLSAARAWIFNRVLSSRVERGDWNRPLPGDLLMFDGGGAFFRVETVDDEIVSRVRALKVHPSGPLWGLGKDQASLEAGEIERRVAEECGALVRGLESMAVKSARRALRVRPMDLSWSWEGDDLQLEFALPAGAYATTLIRELIEIEDSLR